MKPFRFVAPMPRLDQPAGQWRDALRRIEDLGFSAVSVSDHFTAGWIMEPSVALMAAADATRHLRVQSLVLNNDLRHPVLLHKTLATIDVLSGGRLEMGLGAGWMRSDYTAGGLPYDPPGVRISRLEESVHVLKGLFGSSPFTFDGHHYQVDSLEGLPRPVQIPHPPLLLGGGGRRVLTLAAREADIVSVYPNLRLGELSYSPADELLPERIAEKVRWVEEAAACAGRSMADIELHLSLFVCHVADSQSSAHDWISSHAEALHADPLVLERSPAVLSGPVSQCVDALQERREAYGFSCFNLGGDVEAIAKLVACLAGT